MLSVMDKDFDSKRKSRNLSEKKRRDQFNNLINELSHLIDPSASVGSAQADTIEDDDGIGSCSNFNGARAQRKMDKSSVLKCVTEFLKKHGSSTQQQMPNPGLRLGKRSGSINNIGSCEDIGSGRFLDYNLLSQTATNEQFKFHNTSTWKPSYITDDEFSVQMLEALDAFIVVCAVDEDARIIYSSDTLTNLLNYTGTCNSLRQNDYVSLFDLIAPSDRQQIEQLLSQEPNTVGYSDLSSAQQTAGFVGEAQDALRDCLEHSINLNAGAIPTNMSASNLAVEDDYVSLVVNFRTGLNLSEIKQKRQKEKAQIGFDESATKEYKSEMSTRSTEEVLNHGYDLDSISGEYSNLIDTAISHQAQSRQQTQQQHQQQQQHYQRLQSQSGRQRSNEQDMVYMQVVDDGNRSTNCSRSQHSIAEKQQLLMSEGRREQQEHNQHEQHAS